ncbi:terpene synthase [Chitinophaga polysaccharea]|uniref:terpene synthase family protein n=1 Tax=Chitinophaga polysaccharea TaxID=1293035 RepID=UPI001455091E|nr:terpene synthase [Chitinophaga polysaccharea]NLR58191.1 terpene synthase [Chitinophaga polysaccharea]
MNAKMLSLFSYPFPTLKNPFADALQEITDNQWIDGEYLWLYKDDPQTRQKYKKTKTAHIASQWFPTSSQERLKPVCRFMLWTLFNDDKYEEGTPEQIRFIHQQSIAVLQGEVSSAQSGIPLGGLLASLREELLQFISEESLRRFITGLSRYFRGLELELEYKQKRTFPSIEECIAIRENSLCLYPFLELTDLETGIPLPPGVNEHPVLQRLRALAVRMMVYFNEVQSVVKDEATGSIYYNVVKAIQYNKNLSLEEACLEDLRIHNEELKEFVRLQQSLPDFGEWQDVVVNRVHYISMTLSGWKSVSSRLERYNSLQGFPSAQAIKKTVLPD